MSDTCNLRSPADKDATTCDLCGNALVTAGGLWTDRSVPADADPDLCLLNEVAAGTFGPHHPSTRPSLPVAGGNAD